MCSDEPDPTQLITYTVELPKFAGPPGITIAGSEQPFEPVFISKLQKGGYAEKLVFVYEAYQWLQRFLQFKCYSIYETIIIFDNFCNVC